jgi:hypothetical protein
MVLIHIYATLSADEHMSAQFMLSTGLGMAVLRVLCSLTACASPPSRRSAGAARIRVMDGRSMESFGLEDG